MLREVQIACSVELAWIIFVGVDFKVRIVVVITLVPVELAGVSMDHT